MPGVTDRSRKAEPQSGGALSIGSRELTASVTALANALACHLTDEELSLLGTILSQLGDTLATISAHRSLQGK